ncbi:MAG: hypothetical protein QG597_1291 [Actinomycetota bacterium]|nr:hypothetical protein [Actinomycetota bacterium]
MRQVDTLRDWMIDIWQTYLSKDASARYDWHLGAGAALVIGVPLVAGVLAGHEAAGFIAALSAWLTAVAVPKPGRSARIRQFGWRAVMLTAAAALGLMVAGNLWATVAAAATMSLLAPLPGVAVTPLILMMVSTSPQPTVAPGLHLALCAVGCLWAATLLMIPFFGGPFAPEPPAPPREPVRSRAEQYRSSLRRAFRERNPKLLYGLRLCTTVVVALLLLHMIALPHATWALMGIVTTLRPSWGQTKGRVTKRLIGVLAGCVLTAVLIVPVQQLSPLLVCLLIAVLGGVARPLRQYNYGFWPIFATPVMLLLISLAETLTWVDVAERLVNNILGALLAVAATLLLWPPREERLLPERIARLLHAEARYLERAAFVMEYGPQPVREGNYDKAAAAEADLRHARDRLAEQPRPPAQILVDLDRTITSASALRALIHVGWREGEFASSELLALAGALRSTGAACSALSLEQEPPVMPVPLPGPGGAQASSLQDAALRCAYASVMPIRAYP